MTVGEDILIKASRALAHGDGLAPTLGVILDALARRFGIATAAIVVRDAPDAELRVAAAFGLDANAAAGLTDAMRRDEHPVTRTFSETQPTYDVTPMNPGGPALRSHLPLIVRRDGTDRVVGVLALAYDGPIDADRRPVIEAIADLAAVALERHHG